MYAASGHLQWTSADGAAIALNAPQRWALPAKAVEGAAAAPTAAPTLPKWIAPEQLKSLDAQASEFLAASLEDGKPLLVALREMVDHPRRVEIKSLGAQCLAMLDEFEPLVSTFNDADQRPMWTIEIASVKAALGAARPLPRKFGRLSKSNVVKIPEGNSTACSGVTPRINYRRARLPGLLNSWTTTISISACWPFPTCKILPTRPSITDPMPPPPAAEANPCAAGKRNFAPDPLCRAKQLRRAS